MVAETTLEKVGREVFGLSEPDYCTTYRVEVRCPDGTVRFYGLRAATKDQARIEGIKLIGSMVDTYQDDRIVWRMANDSNWSFGTKTQSSSSTIKDKFKKILNAFFEID